MFGSCGETSTGAIHWARRPSSAGRMRVSRRAAAGRRPRRRRRRGAATPTPAAGGRRNAQVGAREVPVEPVRIDDVRVLRIDRLVRAFAAGRALPVDRRNPVAPCAEIDAAAAAADVLDRAVGPRRACSDRARRCRTARRRPTTANFQVWPRIVGRVEAAVVRVVDDLRVRRDRSTGRDDRRGSVREFAKSRTVLPPSRRDVQPEAHRVDRVLVARIDADLPEHPAVGAGVAGHELVRLAHLAPRRALVVGAVDLGRLDARLVDRPAVGVALAFLRRPPGS